ncbi:hypothetical protein SAMN04487948_103459 [Halogranum amylolyticum]|uniref:Uncharacterized protein n=1 Tax=Halogranum amylolyticum TaxID=660520 RepID=A0A1H8R2Y0_9EURY|nr:hypothetical protein SAMN04487948_103459 [Halogranum amylolyticum]
MVRELTIREPMIANSIREEESARSGDAQRADIEQQCGNRTDTIEPRE